MTQFMKPHLFDEDQRDAVQRILAELGIGDEEGRRIFVYALEYEVAQYEAQQANEPPTPAQAEAAPASGVFAEVAAAAETLRERLRELSTAERQRLGEALTQTDRLARAHGEAYFAALQAELKHLLAAGERMELPPPAPPALAGAKRRFVAMLAKAYKDCFEEAPSAAPDGAFFRLLQALARELGIAAAISSDELLDLFYKTDWNDLTLSRR
jgi:hypothetical protein